MYRLERKDFDKALPLFDRLHFTIAINAIIEGNRLGEIYVDNLNKPKSAFVLATRALACYLVGFPDNEDFNTAVKRLLVERITPKVNRSAYDFFVMRYFPHEWDKKIEEILKNQRPWKSFWIWFDNVEPLNYDWKKGIPVDFSVETIDEEFLNRVELKNFDIIMDIVLKWSSIDDFLRKGFGFCLTHGSTIVSWCILNKRFRNRCEFAVGTDEAYRNAGFATLMGEALLEYCLSNNLEPCWHCPTDNLASKAVAEKLGFKKVLIYATYNWFPRWYTYLHWVLKTNPKRFFHTTNQYIQHLFFT